MDAVINIVIPVYGEHEYLKMCLKSIERAINFVPEDKLWWFQVNIMDNGASEEDKKIVKDKILDHWLMKKRTILLPMEKNLMFAGAVNEGFYEHSFNLYNEPDLYHMILNSDTILPINFFERFLLKARQDTIYGPMTNRCAGKQCDPDHSIPNDHYKLAECDCSWLFTDVDDIAAKVMGRKPESVRWVNGFCFIVPQKVIEEIGVLDEEEFPLSGEEIDFCYRAYEAGFRLMVDHGNFCYHFKGQTVKSNPGLEEYWKVSADKLRKKYDYFPSQEIPPK